MAGQGKAGDGRARTPRGELVRLGKEQQRQAATQRERIMEAMLETCGALGYRETSVQDVLDRYGGYRAQFYRHFANKAECYWAAHAAHLDRLCDELLRAAAAEPTWRHGLRAALRELTRFIGKRPELARGLLVEVHVAGGP
ncbi:MAG TPA: TetR/AcrR family transcriptional regulator, partial [Solirubrobacterales bacterium]|nr:TetR/AcrR family transcriptional regulator [Solirubrobacterales bacterium]